MAVSRFALSFDIGKKIAKSLVNLDNPLSKFKGASLTPLLVRKDGRVYKDFEEGLYYELCMGYIEDNWDAIQMASLMGVETQMSIDSQNDKRLTILIHNTMFSILSTLHHEGLCCPVISVSPVWWRKAADAKAPRVEGGSGAQYHANKQKSVERFTELYGTEAVKELKQLVPAGQSVVDMMESVLIGYALATNPTWVHKKLYENSSHSGILSKPGAPVKKEFKHVEIKKLCDIKQNNDITCKDLLILHSESLSHQKNKQNKRIFKKIEKDAIRSMGVFANIPMKEPKKRKVTESKKPSVLDIED